ncbi:PREDICTED: sodium-dependent multivitamin transporter-like, partial [Priapulus caudatus]|uniref:Sodium-dependent multivitamin transporter-like n=1 Tax=Priapulus caudatus TaxID=37621 RepID=A0ABM1F395_PRICU
GIQFMIATIGQIINIPFAAHVFLPIYFKLRLTSVYEYLELRYKSKPVRILGSILFTIQMVSILQKPILMLTYEERCVATEATAFKLLYLAVVLYAPSLAVNAVTGLDIWIIMVIVAVVCTFYTTIGGLKAVIWTDVFQMVVMFGGMIAIYFLGVDKVGGFSEMWTRCKENGRIDGIIWDPDPTIYQSVWSMAVGYTFYWLSFYGVNQVIVQRYCSMPTLRDAQKPVIET